MNVHGNKYPLFSKALSRLPLGAIKPAGRLLDQLIQQAGIPENPSDHKRPPVTLAAGARRISAWGMNGSSAADVPVSPVISELPEEEVLLVPYGCTALRIAQLPFYIEKEER